MRPTFGSPSASPTGGLAASFWRWNSPLPYVFGGLAAMMGLIAVALIILLCSNHKYSSDGSSPSSDCEGAAGERAASAARVDVVPKVVVIMAGDAIPSFLAKATPSDYPSQH